MPRIKITVPDLTMDDFVRIAGEVSEAQHAMDTDTAMVNQQIDNLRAAHEELQSRLAQEIKTKSDLLERWASAHREAFGDRKSLDLPRALVGFRTGQPTVKITKGWSVSDAVESVLNKLEDGAQFISQAKPTLNKPAISRAA
jgi:phage host-nuclease inhibitor protein Gam